MIMLVIPHLILMDMGSPRATPVHNPSNANKRVTCSIETQGQLGCKNVCSHLEVAETEGISEGWPGRGPLGAREDTRLRFNSIQE